MQVSDEVTYIVMDLEWNFPMNKFRAVRGDKTIFNEIIQIGAVKLGKNLENVDTFNEIIRPQYYTKMNPKVTEITEITDETVQKGRLFQDVCDEYLKWCGEDFVFFSWGANDIIELERNMEFYGMDTSGLPDCYDLQVIFDDQVTMDGRDNPLNYAIWKLGISAERCHDALNDALNTAEVLRRMDLSDGIDGYEV